MEGFVLGLRETSNAVIAFFARVWGGFCLFLFFFNNCNPDVRYMLAMSVSQSVHTNNC
jgi:hypothetical protein